MDLHQKVILITGASSGIGRATAVALSRRQNRIAIVARREALLKELSEEIKANGSEALIITGDALDEAVAKDAVLKTVSRFGQIDMALLNIGAGPALNTATATTAEIKDNMRLNYDAMINFFPPLVQQMKQQEAGGVIAHTNSLAGFLGIPTQGQYSAAKAACRIFMDTARIELKPYGIRVLTLCPGYVVTERNRQEGVSKLLTMSMPQAAGHIVRALEEEIPEYLFPTLLKMQILLARLLPRFILNWILSRSVYSEHKEMN